MEYIKKIQKKKKNRTKKRQQCFSHHLWWALIHRPYRTLRLLLTSGKTYRITLPQSAFFTKKKKQKDDILIFFFTKYMHFFSDCNWLNSRIQCFLQEEIIGKKICALISHFWHLLFNMEPFPRPNNVANTGTGILSAPYYWRLSSIKTWA